MALVAVVVLWGAYSLVVVGYDKITGGCGPVKPMLWPTKTGGNLHVKCAGVAATATPASMAAASTGTTLTAAQMTSLSGGTA